MTENKEISWCGWKVDAPLLSGAYPPKKGLKFTPYIEKSEIGSKTFLALLAQALCYKMREKNLSKVPPSFLGYSNWQEDFEDLLSDCYEFAVLKRLNTLKAQSEKGKNIDGSIYLNIDHFLFELQNRYDPIGYKVGTTAQRAVQKAVDNDLFQADKFNKKGKIHNPTRLTTGTDQQLCDQECLKNRLLNLPAWENLRSKLRDEDASMNKIVTEDHFYQIIVALAETGLSFKFKDLAAVLKDEIRPWQDILDIQKKTGNKTKPHQPTKLEQIVEKFDNIFEILKPTATGREQWRTLIDKIKTDIDSISSRQNRIRGVHGVFDVLVDSIEAEGPIPKQHELEASLELKTQTLSDYIKVLHDLFEEKWITWCSPSKEEKK